MTSRAYLWHALALLLVLIDVRFLLISHQAESNGGSRYLFFCIHRVLQTGCPCLFGLCFCLNLRMAEVCFAESLFFNFNFLIQFLKFIYILCFCFHSIFYLWLETCEYFLLKLDCFLIWRFHSTIFVKRYASFIVIYKFE